MTRPLTMFATTLEDVIAGRPASFSWRELVARKAPEPSDLRRIIEIKPVLDYTALEPGSKATTAIRQAVADLKLAARIPARCGSPARSRSRTRNSARSRKTPTSMPPSRSPS